MKLHADRPEADNIIHAATRGSVSINGQAHQRSVIVPSHGTVAPWQAGDTADGLAHTLADLTEAHFAMLARYAPELVLFGSGPQLRFVHPRLHAALMAQRIGVDTMDTLAACRTYNILVSEGRRVVAALIIHD